MMTWKRNGYSGAYQTFDRDEIAEMLVALEQDKENCDTCKTDTPVLHSTSSVIQTRISPIIKQTKDTGHSYQCRSLSRWFNPNTRKMEGHAHCTCDYCY